MLRALRIAGPANGAGGISERGREGVARHLNGFRGAAERVKDHADQGLGEQQRASEVGRGIRRRPPERR